ncbi:MAG: glucose 1-dehydrogenase [Sphingobium sp.]|nr:glucose 1-dehydrogenase [Sphingobium sp.]
MTGKLNGRIAVITGGAGGLGKAIGERFADEGAIVCVADLYLAAAEALADNIGRGAFAVRLDVTDAASIAGMVAAVVEKAGRIDILVNSAGIFGLEPWLKITEKSFDAIFAINVKGLVFVTQAVTSQMVAQGGGSVINIASAAGRAGNPMSVAYSASKMTVISLTQSAALGLARQGVRVNAIAPGGILTPMWETVHALYSTSGAVPGDDINAALESSVPLGRLSTPADHIGAAVYFASDESAYVTGQTLNIDGGLFLN